MFLTNYVLMLNRTDYLHKNGFGRKQPTKVIYICYKTQTTNQTKSRIGASSSDVLVSYPRYSLVRVCVCEGVLLLCSDVIGIFYSPSWVGCQKFKIKLTQNNYKYPTFLYPLNEKHSRYHKQKFHWILKKK